jgi:hypothetical protein
VSIGLWSRPVADAIGAPVLRDQVPDRPAGHGKADHSWKVNACFGEARFIRLLRVSPF